MRTEEEIEKKKKDLWAEADRVDSKGFVERRSALTAAANTLEWALGYGTIWTPFGEERKEEIRKDGR